MIKRYNMVYDIESGSSCNCEMLEFFGGKYCKYEDVQKLIKEYEDKIKSIEEELNNRSSFDEIRNFVNEYNKAQKLRKI